uniref:Uncharacterized protein n=1 Tax=Ciona intestinalis TaxID=7719 RepID=H2XWC9_CIOIN
MLTKVTLLTKAPYPPLTSIQVGQTGTGVSSYIRTNGHRTVS